MNIKIKTIPSMLLIALASSQAYADIYFHDESTNNNNTNAFGSDIKKSMEYQSKETQVEKKPNVNLNTIKIEKEKTTGTRIKKTIGQQFKEEKRIKERNNIVNSALKETVVTEKQIQQTTNNEIVENKVEETKKQNLNVIANQNKLKEVRTYGFKNIDPLSTFSIIGFDKHNHKAEDNEKIRQKILNLGLFNTVEIRQNNGVLLLVVEEKQEVNKSILNKKEKTKSETQPQEAKNKEMLIQGVGFIKTNPVEALSSVGFVKEEHTMDKNAELQHNLINLGIFKNVIVKQLNGNLFIQVEENIGIKTIEVNGAKTVDKDNILRTLNDVGIKENNVYNERLLAEFRSWLLGHYKTIGKKHAEIEIKNNTSDDGANIEINITENKTSLINKIEFVGNDKIKSSQIKKIIDSSEHGFTSYLSPSSRINDDRIKLDIEKINNFYHNNGYIKAKVVDVEITEQENKKFKNNIKYVIFEGEQYNFDSPEFLVSKALVETVTQEKIKKLNRIKVNTLYKKDDVVRTSQDISYLLSSNGYAFNKVDIDVQETGNNKVKFVFSIKEDRKANIGDIIISGNKKTKDEVIAREIRQKKGDEFDLSKIQRSKERLDLTGHFYQTKITPTTNENGLVDLNVEVEERRSGNIEVSAGYTQDYGITYGASASDTNFRGTGREVSAKVSNSAVKKTLEFNFNEPFLTKGGISLDTSIYGNIYDPRKYKSDHQNYKTDKYGANFVFGVPVSEYDKIYIGTGVEKIKLNTYGDAPKVYRDFIKEQTGNETGVGKYDGTLGKATIGWGRNKTNHAYWPTKGYAVGVKSEITVPGSSLQFYKANTNGRYYVPIGQKSTIGFSGKFGYANSYGKTKKLPFFENYYAGGLGSVRGFETSTLGPKVYDRNNSIVSYGGTKFVSATAEFQTPIPFVKDSKNVRLSAFVDVASVWDGKTYTKEDSDNGLSVYEKKHKSTMKSEVRTSVGIAYTWMSPIGALKFSYAKPLKKKKGDEIQKFQFQIGTVF